MKSYNLAAYPGVPAQLSVWKRIHRRAHGARKALSHHIFRVIKRGREQAAKYYARHRVSIILVLLRLRMKKDCSSEQLSGVDLRGFNLRGVSIRDPSRAKWARTPWA